MIVCIDTNVVLGMFTAGHAQRPIFDAWFAGRLSWAVSPEILFEYEEILQRNGSLAKATTMMNLIIIVESRHGNMLRLSPSFHFNLIIADADDNKFADCAIAAHADFIITSDKHFNGLIASGYKPQPITPEVFIAQHLAS